MSNRAFEGAKRKGREVTVRHLELVLGQLVVMLVELSVAP